MEVTVQNYLIVFLLGLGAMITFHNTILSAKKFFSRRYGRLSDTLRIICNFGNLWRFLLSLGYFMTPSNVTSAPCKALGYLYLTGFHLFHVSLYAFSLWTLYRMSNNKKDLWISIVFLLVQASFIIPEMLFIKPASLRLNWKSTNFTNELFPERYCELILSPEYLRLWATIILGFLMVTYVIIRITYLAKKRKSIEVPITSKKINENDSTSTTPPNVVAARRPLSLPMVYWSLTLSLLTFMLVLLSALDEKPDKLMLMSGDTSIFGLAYKEFLYILISYIVTYLDSEKRKNVIFYNCGGDGENLKNSSNKLDGEAWIICSKKEKKKDVEEEKEEIHAQV